MTMLEDSYGPLAGGSPVDLVLGLAVAAYDAGENVRIEAALQRDGSTLWAVRRGGMVLANDWEWEFEPMPSSRDDEFFARCRYATPQHALAVLQTARRRPNVRDKAALPQGE
jgi:hypothetical protein